MIAVGPPQNQCMLLSFRSPACSPLLAALLLRKQPSLATGSGRGRTPQSRDTQGLCDLSYWLDVLLVPLFPWPLASPLLWAPGG